MAEAVRFGLFQQDKRGAASRRWVFDDPLPMQLRVGEAVRGTVLIARVVRNAVS
jgi:hypothetical protein